MDPIGIQKKIKGNSMSVDKQKLHDDNDKAGGYKSKYSGNRNMSSGTKRASTGKLEGDWQGTVKGATKHTYKGE